ncbi:prepilin-type N-terminal cleavage/methylation domain-containing protein [Halarsenatibacter silvermanii]|uniref:Prepilin-type N-terminal cleavage/methylation domain-containing protein n=1 Tax=Halarsenatibacter silvermanii TaxID=321763 RepID=A0A1G9LBJ5_9FIRM|nr:prepilin-type N-terminal cleavage/methylation domain-containing protein [Halarsenatibacter silvermanii]SDL59341.1 prepilin-type N-terminal cleavage/methylation domain-containing protein [Halarsenatibacter silvermanii]
MNRLTKVFRNQGGFTLIELLIVIGIIGILVAIILPNFGDLFARADESAARADMNALRAEIYALRAELGSWSAVEENEEVDAFDTIGDKGYEEFFADWSELDDGEFTFRLQYGTETEDSIWLTEDGIFDEDPA